MLLIYILPPVSGNTILYKVPDWNSLLKLSQASLLTILGLLALGAFLLTVPIASVSANADGLFRDADKDGYIDAADGGEDCDDDNDTVYPGAPQINDGLDNDCDGDGILTKADILIKSGVGGKGLLKQGKIKWFNNTKAYENAGKGHVNVIR